MYLNIIHFFTESLVFWKNDLQLELFVRCLCLDSTTPVRVEEVKQTLSQFLNEILPDARDYVEEILIADHHGYLTTEDRVTLADEKPPFLDLDRLYAIGNDTRTFDELMAIIQTNATRDIAWEQTIREIHDLVAGRNIWLQLAPLLQLHTERGK